METITKVGKYNFIPVTRKNLKVTFCDLGASIYLIEYCGSFMTFTPADKEKFFETSIYHGKTIGRVANRIAGSSIVVNNQTYQLENNEGVNVLHGGHSGISTKAFEYVVTEKEEYTEVVFKYLSKHLEAGFPGNVDIKITYKVFDDSVEMIQEAISDCDTPISLTNHAYYCLGEPSLDGLKLKINASRYVHPNPKDLIPVEVRNVDEVMDFRNLKDITKYIDVDYLVNSRTYGYDHCFIFDTCGLNEPKVILESKNFRLKFITDYEAVQIYSDNYDDTTKWLTSTLTRRRSIAIEPGYVINKVNMLKKNEKYSHIIKLEFEKK